MNFRYLIAGCCAVVLLWAVSSTTAASGVADAAMNRDVAAVRSLLQQKADVNAPQADGATALHWAAHWDDLETADLLVRAGAHVNAANELGVTPLSLACGNANAAMVARLSCSISWRQPMTGRP